MNKEFFIEFEDVVMKGDSHNGNFTGNINDVGITGEIGHGISGETGHAGFFGGVIQSRSAG